jgi:hypothetical protein
MARRLFSHIPLRRPKKNVFDLSHDVKLSLDMGQLVPIYVEDVVPGDKFRVRTEVMLRFAPMLAPIMHRVNVFTHFFFVPYRLLWKDWEDFITGGRTGTVSPVFPRYSLSDSGVVNKGTLFDYLGFPAGQTLLVGYSFSKMPFLAYQLIYDQYYRDQNLEQPFIENSLPGSSGISLVNISGMNGGSSVQSLRYRAWEKDYFTSALPWAQRGGEVNLPFSGEAPVDWKVSSTGSKLGELVGTTGVGGTANLDSVSIGAATTDIPGSTRVKASVDFSEASSVTINDLRRSIKLQEWLEKNARGGARYIEQIFSHFGVKSSDARLQRVEFLGGGKTPVMISEVLQTSGSPTASGSAIFDTPLASMAGHGISVGSTHEFTRFFEEHGLIMGIMSVMPKTAYQQGTPRMFTKFDKFDYYFPEFAHLGEQEIKNKELYTTNNQDYNEGTFGYTPRYAEYKYRESRVCGDFRDQLNYWHLGRIFSSTPNLNSTFVHPDSATLNRIFAVQDDDTQHLWCQVYHNIKAVRPMPKFGTPII